ncbi:unnamed protein product [Ciceribacter sp. T2.26MG-112.2]|nr:unnamed protein product [Ciceribacter naphthalenivorans]
MDTLYLVVILAANAKYSINSLLPPVPASCFRRLKIAQKGWSGERPHGPDPRLRLAKLLKRTGLVMSGSVAAAT